MAGREDLDLVARFERMALLVATLRDAADRVDEMLRAYGCSKTALDA